MSRQGTEPFQVEAESFEGIQPQKYLNGLYPHGSENVAIVRNHEFVVDLGFSIANDVAC